jgi:hypothetical protein
MTGAVALRRSSSSTGANRRTAQLQSLPSKNIRVTTVSYSITDAKEILMTEHRAAIWLCMFSGLMLVSATRDE